MTLRLNGSTSGYVEIDAPAVAANNTITLPSSGNLATTTQLGNRNRIINGDMRIDQRNAGASVTPTTDNTYTLDRWTVRNFGGSGRFSIQNTTASVPTGFSHSAVLTVTTADATNASTYSLCQRIEGFNTSDLGLGSTTANNISISFWVRSSLAGTYCVSVRNNNADRSYVSEYTISAANTWEYKTITLPTVASGTWEVTNSVGILLDFILGSNSGRETTAGAWQSGNFLSTSNQTEWIATNGATFYITGVQLEQGSTATPFERRSYGQELALCQRYYQHKVPTWGTPRSGDNYLHTQAFFKVTMRVNPTLTLVDNQFGQSVGIQTSTPDYYVTGAAGSASTSLNATFNASAEL